MHAASVSMSYSYSYKRKFYQDAEVEIEDSEGDVMSSQHSPKCKIRRTRRSSLKEWMKCDPDLQAFHSTTTLKKCRVSLFNRTDPTEKITALPDVDAELIAWSMSEDSDDSGTNDQHLSQCIIGTSQKSSPQHSQLISSYESAFCTQSSLPSSKCEEIADSISPSIRISPSSQMQISSDLFKPICPDLSKRTRSSLLDFVSACEEAEISPPSSPVAAPPVYHGTTWLQGIHWQPKTPEKLQGASVEVDLGSSKKKCLRGGFADQLRKLEVRRKSFQNMWLHEKYKQGDSKVLILKVFKVISENGLTKAKCNVLQNNNDVFSSPLAEEPEPIRKTDETFDQCTLLLSKNMNVPVQDIVVGSMLHIHPPMHKLKVPVTEETLIICPQFVEIVVPNCVALTPDDENEGGTMAFSSEASDVVFQWECPCRNGVCSADMCPLQSTEPTDRTTVASTSK